MQQPSFKGLDLSASLQFVSANSPREVTLLLALGQVWQQSRMFYCGKFSVRWTHQKTLSSKNAPHWDGKQSETIKTLFLGKQNCIKFKFLSVLDLNVSSQCDLWGLLVGFFFPYLLCVQNCSEILSMFALNFISFCFVFIL